MSEQSSRSTKSNHLPTTLLAIVCLIAVIAGGYIGAFGLKWPGSVKPPEIAGFLWPNQKVIAPFEMIDQSGSKINLDSIKDEWNLVFFGYTHCPDICPITMLILKQADEQIKQLDPERHKNTRVTFVSVDGKRDTPEHLTKYIDFFNPEFRGLTGNKLQVDSLTKQLGIPYQIEDHEPGAIDYLVAHSGAVLLLTPNGTVASIFQAPHEAKPLADNYLAIRKFMESNS